MNGCSFARGDKQAAVRVMLDAAQWLESRGIPLWTRTEIEALPENHPAEEFLVLYAGGHPAAAALLTEVDPLFWPHVPPGSSGFLHKLSVRRAYAGRGLAVRLIEYAALECKNAGRQYLRLDCDAAREKLKSLYRSAGFVYIGEHLAHTETHGTVRVALFELALRADAGGCDKPRFLV